MNFLPIEYSLPISIADSVLFSSVQLLSHVQFFATPWPQHARPSCPSTTPRVYPSLCPLSRWYHIQQSHPLSSPSLPALSQHQGLFKWVSSSHWVAKILEFHTFWIWLLCFILYELKIGNVLLWIIFYFLICSILFPQSISGLFIQSYLNPNPFPGFLTLGRHL